MSLDAAVETGNFQNQLGADASAFVSHSPDQLSGGRGSSINRRDVSDSLRSVFQEANDDFTQTKDLVRQSFGGDKSGFKQFFRDNQQAFDQANREFQELRGSAAQAFSQNRSLSSEQLEQFRSQAESLFQPVLDQFSSRLDPDKSGDQGSQGDQEDQGKDALDPSYQKDDPTKDGGNVGADKDDPEDGGDVDPIDLNAGEEEELAFNQVAEASLSDVKSLDPNLVQTDDNIFDQLGANGDVLDGGGGNNVVIGAGGNDVFLAETSEAFNTITTGTGNDLIILGLDGTTRAFDFDPTFDKFGLDGIDFDTIRIGQGTNLGKGGVDQPLDSISNTIILDRATNNILASLTFVDSATITESNFVRVDLTNDLKELLVSLSS